MIPVLARSRLLRVALAALPALLFVGVALPSIAGMNPLMDEMTDLQIVYSFFEAPLTGSSKDASQARLPMYVAAVPIALVEIVWPAAGFEAHVAAARVTSILASAVSLLLLFVLASRWIGPGAALLASTLTALSPYFLDFGRLGFTEGDAFGPLAMLGVLFGFERFERRPDGRGAVLLGVALGAAIAIKFTFVVLAPALAAVRLGRRALGQAPYGDPPPGPVPLTDFGLALLSAAAACTGLFVGAATARAAHPAAVSLWALSAGVITALLLRRRDPPQSSSQTWLRWPIVLALAAAVALTVAPAHLLQPGIFAESVARAGTWDAGRATEQPEPLWLYGGLLLGRHGLPLGVLMIGAFVWTVATVRHERHRLLLASITATWGTMLALLPLQQPFYAMPVFPLIAIMAADLIRSADSRLRAHAVPRVIWRSVAAAAAVSLATGVIRSYPVFGYAGYELVGTAWWGRDTRGARHIVRVTNDGTLDAYRWAAANLRPGSRLLTLAWDSRTLELLQSAGPLPYAVEIAGARPLTEYAGALARADALLVTLQNRTRIGNAPPDDLLGREFGPPVHVVHRGRGEYRMAVVELFVRREPPARATPAALPRAVQP